MRLNEDDNGRQVTLERGQALVVSLEGNPSTGYRWEVSDVDPGVLRPLGEAAFEPRSDLVGAPGVEITRFQAAGAGQATLTMVYRRPWEQGVAPLETFSVQVTVR